MNRATNQSITSNNSAAPMPFSRRKTVLGTMLATLGAGVTATGAAAAVPSPDAALIAACQRFEALEWQRFAICDGPDRIDDEAEQDEAVASIQDTQEELADAIANLRATTFEGCRALAQIVAQSL